MPVKANEDILKAEVKKKKTGKLCRVDVLESYA